MTEPRRPVEPPASAPRSGRPSLTGSDDAAKAGQSVSVLSAVTPPSQPTRGPVPRSVSAALPWIGVVTLAIIGIIFWMELSGPSAPKAPETVAMVPPTPLPAPAGEVAPPPPPPSSSSSSAATISESSPTTATIETERPAPAAPVVAAKKPVAVPDDLAAKKVPPAKLAAAAPVAPAVPEPAQRSPFAAIDKPAAPAAPVRKPKPGNGDRDSDLVAALLSRSPTGAPVAPVARPEPPPASRDVVERDPVISTDKLLKRCESLGVLEAELCKARICSGLWGKDSSCPARPPAAQPTTASAVQTGN